MSLEDNPSKLKKILKPFDLIMMGVGCIIGVGIYILSGVASANYAGPAIIISFILAGCLCAIVGLCYGELASMFPLSGSAYSYSYHSLGRATAWFLGWTLILEYMIAASAVSAGWSSYFQKFLEKTFNINLPNYLTNVPGTIEGHWSINLPAVFVLFFITILSIWSMKESAKFNNFMALLKISVLLFFIIICLPHVNPANWTPFIPERIATIKEITDHSGIFELPMIDFIKKLFFGIQMSDTSKVWHYGIQGILTGSAIIFFTYVGFDMVSSVAEETENPQRDVPIGIIGSLLIATILYICVTLVLTGVMPASINGLPNETLVSSAPLSVAIDSVSKSKIPLTILSIGALAGLTTSILTLTIALSRITLAIARDKFMPVFLAHIHPERRTPHIAIIIMNSLVALIAMCFPVDKLAKLCNIGTLGAFTLVCFIVILLRIRDKERKRIFKCPFVPALPIAGIIFCTILMISLPIITWLWYFVWLSLGAIIYIFYSRARVERFPK